MKYQNLPELAQAECGLVLLELRMPSSGSDGYVNSILEKIKAAPDYAKAFLLELAATKESMLRAQFSTQEMLEYAAIRRLEVLLADHLR